MAVLFAVPIVVIAATLLLSKALFVVAMLVLALILFYFIVCWSLIGPVMIVERHYGMAALRRSRELVLGSWWRTIAILITAGLIAGVPAAALRFVWGFIPVIGLILTAATQAVSTGYSGVAVVIYYFDRRCRTEDFDLRLLAEQIRSQSAAATTAAPGSSSRA